MKYFVCIFLSAFFNAQIKTEILKIQSPESYITVRISNNTDKKVIIYDCFLVSQYSISNNDSPIALEGYTNGAHLDAGNYQHNFSKGQIEKAQKKYNLSYDDAVYFLQNIKTSFIIDPKSKTDIVLRAFHKRSNPTGAIEEGVYYLKGKLSFSTYYFPQAFKAGLIKNGFTILDEIEIPKTLININDFFLKEVKK